MMRRATIATIATLGAASGVAAPASAATMIIYADPMTFETRRVVIDLSGPNRTFMCLMPPSQAGCHEIKRAR
ncbi:MAG: hypothetical protein ABIR25_02715 [Sphingomicrobium sp.]